MVNLGPEYKTLDLSAFGGLEGFLLVSAEGGNVGAEGLRASVPWLAKAQDMTANAISELPFDIVSDGGAVIDSSDDWQNKLGGMQYVQSLLYKLASSLCSGRAYLIPQTISRGIVSLQYCAPSTVIPRILQQGLIDFDRVTQQGASLRYYPASPNRMDGYAGEMMYFWLPDSDVEIGPAHTTPMSTALIAAGLIQSMDATISANASRGFVPPTVIAAKGMASKDEREKTENWWNRFLHGWTKTQSKIVNAENVSIQKIGAGMDELKGSYSEITKQAIENIGTAYGIPAALFMSDMAFATEVNPMIKVWYTTSVFIKIYHTIEETFNSQLLNRFKCKLQFKPETLDAFQEDEVARAGAFQTYVSAGIKRSVAAEMVGLELPEGVEYDDLDPDDAEVEAAQAAAQAAQQQAQGQAQEKPQEQAAQGAEDEPAAMSLNAAQIKDLDLWRQVAVRNYRKGKGCAADFKCQALPDDIADGIRARLRGATNEGEIVAAFEIKATVVDRIMALDNRDLIERALAVLER